MRALFLDRNGDYAVVNLGEERRLERVIQMFDSTAQRELTLGDFTRLELDETPLPRIRTFEFTTTMTGEIAGRKLPSLPVYIERGFL